MCIAFQCAAPPSDAVGASVTSPFEARCALISLTSSEARSGRGVPHEASATQSPTALAPAAGTNVDEAAVASRAAAAAVAAAWTARLAACPRGLRLVVL
jgi:hypothetical protein